MGINKVCIIDTERGSASLYSDSFGDYDVVELTAPYSPSRYIECMNFVASQGYEMIVIDSITPEWNGKGGCLEMHSNIPGNSYTAWKSITPLHQQFIDATLALPCHVVVTMRAKNAYVLEENEKGKMVPQKKGMEPQQRDGYEYELTSVFELDMNHNFIASKDRTSLFQGNIPQPFDESVGTKLIAWLNSGVTPAAVPAVEPVVNERDIITNLVARLQASDIAEAIALKDEWKEIKATFKPKKAVVDHVEKIFKEKEQY